MGEPAALLADDGQDPFTREPGDHLGGQLAGRQDDGFGARPDLGPVPLEQLVQHQPPRIGDVCRVAANAVALEPAQRQLESIDQPLHGGLGVHAILGDRLLHVPERARVGEDHPVDGVDLRVLGTGLLLDPLPGQVQVRGRSRDRRRQPSDLRSDLTRRDRPGGHLGRRGAHHVHGPVGQAGGDGNSFDERAAGHGLGLQAYPVRPPSSGVRRNRKMGRSAQFRLPRPPKQLERPGSGFLGTSLRGRHSAPPPPVHESTKSSTATPTKPPPSPEARSTRGSPWTRCRGRRPI